MIELQIKDICIRENEYCIKWDVSSEVVLFYRKEIYVQYDFELKKNYFFPINIALSIFLPVLVKEYRDVRITAPYKFCAITINYWNNYLKKNLHSSDFTVSFETTGNPLPEREGEIFSEKLDNIGLLFGGGVETLFALSTMYQKKPVLISIIGEYWMNNDTENAAIKFALERDLCDKYALTMQRIEMNARSIMCFGDEYMNRHITGGLFYFLSLPVADRLNIGVICQSTESEALADMWLSISPRFSKELFIKEAGFPLYFNIYNGYSKAEMFEELAKTDFIKYIYSCFFNSGKRWCGECSKCYRISEYCERIGLDRALIGMQEGIRGKRERSPLSMDYWVAMDRLYGRRYKRELSHLLIYYWGKLMNMSIKDIVNRYRRSRVDLPYPVSGFMSIEGPYPQWGLPVVRWGLFPESLVILPDKLFGKIKIFLSVRSKPETVLIVTLNETELCRHVFPGYDFEDIKISVSVAKGRKTLRFKYYGSCFDNKDNFDRAVLFKKISIKGGRTNSLLNVRLLRM